MPQHRVCLVAELPPGSRKIIEVEGRSIGVFNIGGRFYALKNTCPHQFAPLCRGTLTGYNRPSEVGAYDWVREGEIIRCPWHAWEFDVTTGKSIFNPHKVRTKVFPVRVQPEEQVDPAVETFGVDVVNEAIYVAV